MFASNYNYRVGHQPSGPSRSVFRPSTAATHPNSYRCCSHTCNHSQTLHIRVASTTAELRAAASLRAAAFSEHALDRSDFALQVLGPCIALAFVNLTTTTVLNSPDLAVTVVFLLDSYHDCECVWSGHDYEVPLQSYRRMKADSEWEILESKLAGKEPGYQARKHCIHLNSYEDHAAIPGHAKD